MTSHCIGEHDGAALYTLVQRHGLRLLKSASPYYVTRVDIPSNTVFVSHVREDAAVNEIRIDRMHWIAGSQLAPVGVTAQARYRETPISVSLTHRQDSLMLKFKKPHIAAPG